MAKRRNLNAHRMRGPSESSWVFEEKSSKIIMRNRLLTDQEALDWLNAYDEGFWTEEILDMCAEFDSIDRHARLAANPVDWAQMTQKAMQRRVKDKSKNDA